MIPGQHGHRVARLPRLEPAGKGGLEHLGPAPAHQPAVGLVVGQHRGVAPAQAEAGLGLPGLGEAADLGQLGGRGLGHQEGEQPAGPNGAELAVVTDEHHLGPGLLGQSDQGGQIGRGHRGGLVEDHHLALPQPPGGVGLGSVVLEQELGQGVRGQSGLGLQDPGGHRRDGQTQHRHAG